jgi:hypothetical protein
MTTFHRPIIHRCDKNPDPARFVVRYNDFGVQIAGIPGVTKGCPFCWTSYMTFRRERFERYTARAFVARPSEVGLPAADVVRRLERPEFPENGILSHHGVHTNVRGLGISLTNHGSKLQINMYQSLFRRPAVLHQARARAVAEALVCGIQETWNGKDGSDGISVVLTRNAPDAILLGIENYRKQKDVFRPTSVEKAGWEAFRAWYDAPLAQI